MKIRNGFVSNSSSSSFIIAITEVNKPCPSCGRKDPDFLGKFDESRNDDTCISIKGKKEVIEKLRSWGEEKEEINKLIREIEEVKGEVYQISISNHDYDVLDAMNESKTIKILREDCC